MSEIADAKAIFGRAVEIESPAERAIYLEGVCNGNPALRAELDRLLGAADQAGSFMREPAVPTPTATFEPITEGAGAVIGPYKLLQQIGEGGMGVVFMAEQTRPIQRVVALKIIRPGMDTRQVIARLEAERQALAMMDHPNIAKVLDAGTTETERPYFVMELVKGVPITKFCDERKLSLRERLGLLVPVCHAVQHAHQKGVIHRDLKPTNVLVAEYDDQAVPKIIDFGVAKATAQKLTDRTMFTEFGQVLGTFAYMSPEQAKFNQLDIDTRSDIYSLGVLLYELLTGATPFERKRLQAAALDEALRIIREEEPPKPSTKISASATLPVVAANRHTEPARLTSQVRGELDWIVMKALEKDRNRRYETANSLALDLQRYLDEQPVQAGPPSLAYKVRKLVKRNKRAVATAALLGVVIVSAIAVAAASIGWVVRDRQARTAAVESEIELALEQGMTAYGEQRYSDATVAVNRAEGLMQSVATNRELQNKVQLVKADLEVAQGIMDIQSRQLQDLAMAETEYRDAIRLQPGSSLARAIFSFNLALLGKHAEAEKNAREAIRLNPNGPWGHHSLGRVLAVQGKSAEAVECFQTQKKLRPDYARGRLELGLALERTGQVKDAELEFQEAQRLDPTMVRTSAIWGDSYATTGRLWEAARFYRERYYAKPTELSAGMRLALILLTMGERKDYESVCELMIKQFGKTGNDKIAAHRICFACLTSSQPAGDLDKIRQISEMAIKQNPDEAGLNSGAELEKRALALVAYRVGNWQEALKWSHESRAQNPALKYQAQNLVLEAMALHHLSQPDEARKAYDEAVGLMLRSYPYAPHYLGYWTDWALYEPLRQEAAALLEVDE